MQSIGAVAENSAISLPKGGGAISGVGGAFSANTQTGAGGLTVPIALPPGRGGLPDALMRLSY